jgi:N6-adenosine-specific RNA methylase IME4
MTKLNPDALALLPFELRAEIAENMDREDWKPSEIDVMRRHCEEILRKQAKERQTAALKQGDKKPVVESFHDGGRTRDSIGALAGVSGRTIDKIAAVCDAAEPEKYGKLLEDMDRTGRVSGVHRRLKIARQAENIRAEPPPLPGRGPYRVIVIDPPWLYNKRDEDPSHDGGRPYPSMSIDEIRATKVASIAHKDCVLWLWVTNHHMREAFTLLDAWGFQQKTILTWAKERRGGGVGDWLLGQTEHCLMAARGKPTVTLSNQTTLLRAPRPRGAHSRKPVEFYDFVESLCPAPRYADIFSRYRHNEHWDVHGDEAPS